MIGRFMPTIREHSAALLYHHSEGGIDPRVEGQIGIGSHGLSRRSRSLTPESEFQASSIVKSMSIHEHDTELISSQLSKSGEVHPSGYSTVHLYQHQPVIKQLTGPRRPSPTLALPVTEIKQEKTDPDTLLSHSYPGTSAMMEYSIKKPLLETSPIPKLSSMPTSSTIPSLEMMLRHPSFAQGTAYHQTSQPPAHLSISPHSLPSSYHPLPFSAPPGGKQLSPRALETSQRPHYLPFTQGNIPVPIVTVSQQYISGAISPKGSKSKSAQYAEFKPGSTGSYLKPQAAGSRMDTAPFQSYREHSKLGSGSGTGGEFSGSAKEAKVKDSKVIYCPFSEKVRVIIKG
jgi:hypothetical protein